MASSTAKKVQLWQFDREPLAGFVNSSTYLPDSNVELLTPAGTLTVVSLAATKCIYFVRDFDKTGVPQAKRTFITRPKLDGLWVRFTFRDGDQLEGVIANNLLNLEAAGFTCMPPDFSGNNQRVFVPKTALESVQVLGVVGSPLNRPARKKGPAKDQIDLFENAG